jgi:hypothetical protein
MWAFFLDRIGAAPMPATSAVDDRPGQRGSRRPACALNNHEQRGAIMTVLPDSTAAPLARGTFDTVPGTTTSAVSWGAIFAGAASAAALSLILLVLGTGIGLTAASPWAHDGTGEALGTGSVIWLALTAALASGLGGYVAGRLRTRWTDAHVDEVHFRDTAHGLVAWAVATIVTAGVMTSTIGAIVDRGASAAATVVAPAAGAAGMAAAGAAGRAGGSMGDPTSYFTDMLFRRDASATPSATPAPGDTPPAAEAVRIFANGLRTGALPAEDIRYAGQLVAQRTGLAQPDAEKRVADTFARAKAAADDAANKAKEAADTARRAAAHASFWIFFSLLLGAFMSSFFAMLGGRQRDA